MANKLNTPLCVDLDGTLIHSDLLLETFLLLVKRNPVYLLLIIAWLLGGKASLKAEIAKRVNLNPAALPYNLAFLDWLEKQRAAGRELWLCTASNYRLANLVAEHLQIFTGVFASTDTLNLSGRKKAQQLAEKFGVNGFDYCGNHRVDLAVWEVSQAAVVVNASEILTKTAASLTEVSATFPKSGSNLFHSMLKALRLHQWAKNVLIFVPLIAAHKISDPLAINHALLAFLAFGLCASSVYLLNDMLDLEDDRQHYRKSKRPFAAGDLSLLVGFALVPTLLLAAVLFAVSLPKLFWGVLGAYYGLTVAYSFALKRLVLVDTITLAGLYTVRIVAGAMAISVPLSFWLLLFSIFLFYSLALVKRYAELDAMQRQGKLTAVGRGYHIEDLPILHSLGAASGSLCVLVLALYINSPSVEPLYRYPQVLWLLCVLLLYWISRTWLKTHRGEMHGDPVVFALKDKTSLIIGMLAVLAVIAAT
ncbi:MAG: UbiA family prenyltransferase [Methylococcales bacterium]